MIIISITDPEKVVATKESIPFLASGIKRFLHNDPPFMEKKMTLLEGFLWLALNIYHEGRSEPQIGQLAIAHVTLNRANEQNISIKDVLHQPHQFNWVTKKSYFPDNIPVFLHSMQLALVALQSHDFTHGATYFHRKDKSPEWASRLTYIQAYGSHKFYR